MKHKKIVITGGTGYLGQALARYFGKENHVIILSRHVSNGRNNNFGKKLVKATDGYNITYWRWDGQHVEKHWAQDIEGADIVINLAGKTVNCRYNERNMNDILSSRVDATRTIGEAIRQAAVPPKLWINAASATIYQNTFDAPNDEFSGAISERKNDNMPYSMLDRMRRSVRKWIAALEYGKNTEQYAALDKDFSVRVCQAWERTFFEQRTPFTRKVALRMAVVLGEGGIVVPYQRLVKWGLGGRQGSGKQMFSWVHAEDVCRTIVWCYDHADAEGVYNCASPNAVSNSVFMSTLRRAMGQRLGLPAYTALLELGAALIGTETELILKSRWVKPAKLFQAGFHFKYEQLEDAVSEILGKHNGRGKHKRKEAQQQNSIPV